MSHQHIKSYIIASFGLIFISSCSDVQESETNIHQQQAQELTITEEQKTSDIKIQKGTICVDENTVKIYAYMYHYIRNKDWDDPNASFINNAVITENFEAQMAAFHELQKNKEVEIIFLSELEQFQEANCYPHENLLVFTADDGWDDNFKNLYPIAKKYNIKFHLSIISDFTKDERYYNFITKDELAILSGDKVIEIIGHTYKHIDLRNLNAHYLDRELCKSKKDLEKLTETHINTLIYPAGKYDQNTIKTAKECGYAYAFSTQNGISTLNDLRDKPYELKRIRVSRHSGVSGLTSYFSN